MPFKTNYNYSDKNKLDLKGFHTSDVVPIQRYMAKFQ